MVLMAALALPLVGLTVLGAGPVPAALGTAFALLPVLPVVAAFCWIDRWEPEPGRLLLTAFLWGAGVATLAAAIGSLVLNSAWSAVVGTQVGGLLGTVVTAPVVEEAFKGLFLILLYATRRREFDGVVDGIVYAGLVGVGFAFTENILYLGTAFSESGLEGGIQLFALRCVLSPFAHPIFTAMTGLAVGAMARSTRGAKVLLPVAGYLGAVLLHGIWNGSASMLGGVAFFLVYAVVMVPLFVVLALVVVWQRRREQRIVATQLPRFVAAGWIAPDEVRLLASLSGRIGWRTAVKRHFGPAAARAVRDYQTAVTELAFLNDRMVRGAVGPDARQWLHDLVTAMLVARQQLSQRYPQALAAASRLARPASVG
jgi:protease PrsW